MIWEFDHMCSNKNDELKMINVFNDNELLTFYNNKLLWKGCFGSMTVITHEFLNYINSKYEIKKLLNLVLTRNNRCSFERIIACLLQKEYKKEVLLGNIHKYIKWGTTINEINNYKDLPIIKVWTGR